MTIKLLTPRGQYPVNAIVTFDAATEAALVADKVATTNLTGGTAYVAPAAGNTPQVVSNVSYAGGKLLDGNGNEITSLVSGDWIDPASTWANLPSPVGNGGKVYRVSDVGPVGSGSHWISTGTRWGTLGGRQLHCAARGSLAAPIATVTGAGKLVLPAGDRVTSGSILLPVGLPQIGQAVSVSAKFRHRGTGGTWTAAMRMGSLDTSSDPSAFTISGTAVDLQDEWMYGEAEVESATTFTAPTFLVPNSPGTTGLNLRNSNFNNAAQLYLSFYAATLNAADSLDLISYRVYLLG